MESSVIFRSFNGALQSVTHANPFLEKPVAVPFPMNASRRCLSVPISRECRRLTISSLSRKASLAFSVDTAQATSPLTSDAVPSESAPQGLFQAKNIQKSTFPNGFEALVLEVCDETDVAEVKLKVGEFEMHLKRNVGTPAASTPIAPAPATLPPAPSKPVVESGSALPQATPKKSTATSTSPFVNTSSLKASKLAALEVSRSNAYALVSSPMVGLFRSARTLKGKKQPPSCKEGDVIKEGQIVGFLDQFGSELPIKSDVAGEILKVLFKDGEPVGFGDPLVAVLPSFPGIK